MGGVDVQEGGGWGTSDPLSHVLSGTGNDGGGFEACGDNSLCWRCPSGSSLSSSAQSFKAWPDMLSWHQTWSLLIWRCLLCRCVVKCLKTKTKEVVEFVQRRDIAVTGLRWRFIVCGLDPLPQAPVFELTGYLFGVQTVGSADAMGLLGCGSQFSCITSSEAFQSPQRSGKPPCQPWLAVPVLVYSCMSVCWFLCVSACLNMAQSGVCQNKSWRAEVASFVTALTHWKLCVQILFICAQHVTSKLQDLQIPKCNLTKKYVFRYGDTHLHYFWPCFDSIEDWCITLHTRIWAYALHTQSESVKSSCLYSDRRDRVELIQNEEDNGDRRKQEATEGQEGTDGFKLSRLT